MIGRLDDFLKLRWLGCGLSCFLKYVEVRSTFSNFVLISTCKLAVHAFTYYMHEVNSAYNKHTHNVDGAFEWAWLLDSFVSLGFFFNFITCLLLLCCKKNALCVLL